MNSAVHFDDFLSEGEQVLNPLAARLDACPQFQVFDSVVVPDPVAVMDCFARSKVASNMFFHDETMDKLPLASPIHVASDVATWVCVVLSSSYERLGRPAGSLHLVVDEAESMSRVFAFTVLHLARFLFHAPSIALTVTLCIRCRPGVLPRDNSSHSVIQSMPMAFQYRHSASVPQCFEVFACAHASNPRSNRRF